MARAATASDVFSAIAEPQRREIHELMSGVICEGRYNRHRSARGVALL